MNEHKNEVHHGTVESDHGQVGAKANLMALLAYLGILVIIPFLTDARHDPFVKFHLKQGVALLLFDAVGWIVAIGIGRMPVFGWLVTTAWTLVGLVLAVIGLFNVLQGKERELPLIGEYARNFTF